MALEKIVALEGRIRNLVTLVQELKNRNAQLEHELMRAKERLTHQAGLTRLWEQERSDIRSRIEKALTELEFFEGHHLERASKEVTVD